MPPGLKTGTIVPFIDVALAKALDFQDPVDEWKKTIRKIDAANAQSDTVRLPIWQAPELPMPKARGAAAHKSSFTNYYQDVTFEVMSIEFDWPLELPQDLPDFDAHVKARANESGTNYAERMFQWRTSIMTGSAVDVGVPTLTTTAYDGLSLYTSSTRYRTSGGNTIPGTGMNGPSIRKNFFSGISRMAQYRHDLSGAKIWTAPHTGRYLIEFHPDNWEYFVEAFHAEQVVQSGGYTQSASNQFLAFAKSQGASVILFANAYLSGDSWYATKVDNVSNRETFVFAEKESAHVIPLTSANDGESARTYSEGTVMHGRFGLSPGFPGSTFYVSN